MLECGEIGGFIIRDAIAPADIHDPLPFEGEGADGTGVTFAFGDLGLEEEFGPLTVEGRLAGVLKEALVHEVRATLAAVDPMLVFATLFCHWSYAAVLLDGWSVAVARTLAPKGAGEPGSESGTGAGEALPDGGIAVEGEALLDLPVILFDGKAKLE